MKLSRFAVSFSLCIILVKIVTAKPEAALLQTTKVRQSTSQNYNGVSSTVKPNIPFKTVLDYNSIQNPQQQYVQQQILQQPLRLQQVPLHHQQQVAAAQQVVQYPQQIQPVALPALHPQVQNQILQFVQKALYTSQQHRQPTAMIIIAQPALLPASAVYGNVQQQQQQPQIQPQQQPQPQLQSQQQQVYNYYPVQQHTRYQYVHPVVQQPAQPIAQQTVTQNAPFQIVPISNQYPQNAPVPVQIPTTRMLPAQTSESYAQAQKNLELDQIAQLAQVAAQKYFNSNSYQQQPNAQQRALTPEDQQPSLPPIITGLENFSPEQQVKIKEQLSAHFGGPLQPIRLDKGIQNQIQASEQSDKYQDSDNSVSSSREFVPSVEVKSQKGNVGTSQNTYRKE